MSLKVFLSLAPKIGFASHQNSVAVLQELSLKNCGEAPLKCMVVSLRSDPAFLEPKIWKIDVLEPDSSLRIKDRHVNLEAAFLADLNESVNGRIVLEITCANDEEPGIPTPLFSESYPVELLAKTHWGAQAQCLNCFRRSACPTTRLSTRFSKQPVMSSGGQARNMG